ncbi:MAG: hypothetical protein JXR55_06860 [Candidatus Fermentibacteraceae bacterium]|nr:hypothetical protein [Candidatus Fermentibacteraceae bacterium]
MHRRKAFLPYIQDEIAIASAFPDHAEVLGVVDGIMVWRLAGLVEGKEHLFRPRYAYAPQGRHRLIPEKVDRFFYAP